jgi:DNA-directed RNA polymerase specialized sigma24 family protein
MTNRSELVTAARDGDRHAFADLVELESREAIGLCLSILRCQPDAEDAAQEAFVRAWLRLPSLRDTALWGGWFRRLTVTAAIDFHRKRRNGNLVPYDGQEPAPLPDAVRPSRTRHRFNSATEGDGRSFARKRPAHQDPGQSTTVCDCSRMNCWT